MKIDTNVKFLNVYAVTQTLKTAMYLPVSRSCDQSHGLVWHARQQEARAFHNWARSQCQYWDSSGCLDSAAKNARQSLTVWWLNTIILGLLCMSTWKLLTLSRNALLITQTFITVFTKFYHWTQLWARSLHLMSSSLTFLGCTQILLFYLLLSFSSSIFPSGYTYIYCSVSANFTVLYVITPDNDRNKFNVSSKY